MQQICNIGGDESGYPRTWTGSNPYVGATDKPCLGAVSLYYGRLTGLGREVARKYSGGRSGDAQRKRNKVLGC